MKVSLEVVESVGNFCINLISNSDFSYLANYDGKIKLANQTYTSSKSYRPEI